MTIVLSEDKELEERRYEELQAIIAEQRTHYESMMEIAQAATADKWTPEEKQHLQELATKVTDAFDRSKKAFIDWAVTVNHNLTIRENRRKEEEKARMEKEEERKKFFNHPERCEDEIFIANATMSGFIGMGWKSKRLGNGFPNLGETVYPVFISVREATEHKLIDPPQ
jgi:hypothetical protein